MKTCGIYSIKNKIDGKLYIGKAVNIEGRFRTHISSLKKNKHDNDYLQNAWNKYGSESFEFSILEKCDKDSLNDREIFHISNLKTKRPGGYNLTDGGDGITNPSDSTRKKISESMTGKKRSEESKRKQSESLMGHPGRRGWKQTSEAKRKISIKNTGQKRSDDFRKGVSERNRERVVKEETKEKIRNTMLKSGTSKGENNPRAKISELLVLWVRDLLSKNIKNIKIHKITGVSVDTISRIKNKKGWNHV